MLSLVVIMKNAYVFLFTGKEKIQNEDSQVWLFIILVSDVLYMMQGY